jgi:uncharacterized membrane protein YfcA
VASLVVQMGRYAQWHYGSGVTSRPATAPTRHHAPALAFAGGAAVGLLGGLIGLGGAELRLPLLLSVFGFAALAAVIVNKTMSLVVVVAAVPARLAGVPLADIGNEWAAVVNLLAGSLIGAWLGASWATKMKTATLYRVLAALLVFLAVVFAAERFGTVPQADLSDPARLVAGVVAGFGIGVVAALLGVAGGELLIPTFVLLFAVDTKLAGSLSLLVSLPTMLVAFFRYSRDQAFAVLADNKGFVIAMAAGSVAGSVTGGLLVGVVAEAVLVPLLVALLLFSAVKVYRHQ